MTTIALQEYKKRENWIKINIQINSALRSMGVTNYKGKIVSPLSNQPESEFKAWVLELMKLRDQLA
jgi:hypothetical protein